MSPTLWLITEGKSDVRVMRRFLAAKRIIVQVKSIHPSGGTGIPQLAIELETLLEAILKKKEDGDCVIVLHDADELHPEPKPRDPYKRIRALCGRKKFKDEVTLIVAHDEVEAWLLADKSLCKWLKVKPYRNCDSVTQPSHELNRLIQKQHPRIKWNERYWDEILKHADASGDSLSPSMRGAFMTITTLPCTQKPIT